MIRSATNDQYDPSGEPSPLRLGIPLGLTAGFFVAYSKFSGGIWIDCGMSCRLSCFALDDS